MYSIITVLQICICTLMTHHAFDKVNNVVGFSKNVVAKFFGFLPGNQQFWSLSATRTQIVASCSLTFGFLTQLVAISMCPTMVVVIIFHRVNAIAKEFLLVGVQQHSYNFELATIVAGVVPPVV